MKRFLGLLLALGLAGTTVAQQSVLSSQSRPAGPASSSTTAPPPDQTAAGSNAAFLAAADQVLAQMSAILDLPIKHPLKKSLRSKEEIRAYLIHAEKQDRSKAQRYADEKSLEAFGLLPKDFPLDSFMINLLTSQVAGLYDPKAKEFYIADWIPADEQREVMSHELTHALEDQSFGIERWIKSARPNDDAEAAREAVSEGSALAAMVDYELRGDHIGIRDLPDVSGLLRTGAVAQIDQDPNFSRAPLYIRDSLMFPYLSGAAFTQAFLKAHAGWSDLKLLFENPPLSTQQILHPQLYLKGVKPVPVSLPSWKGVVPAQWKLLEENVMGEFNLAEVLKQFLGPQTADAMSPAWAGDRYAVFEDTQTKETPLVFRITLDNPADAARFFSKYSQALENKYPERQKPYRTPNFFQFETSTGDVFLRCVGAECLSVEGAARETYDAINRAIGWSPAPMPDAVSSQPAARLRAPAAVDALAASSRLGSAGVDRKAEAALR